MMEFFLLSDTDLNYRSAYWSFDAPTIDTCCETCEAHFSELIGPLTITFEKKQKRIADYYRIVQWHVISPAFHSFLEESDITGYRLKDTLISDGKGKLENTDFKELAVWGRCGLLSDIKNQEIPNCPTCHVPEMDVLGEQKGLSVNMETWDGTDMFYFDNWIGNLVVTEKAKKLLEASHLTNLSFTNVKDKVFSWGLKQE